MQTSSRVLPILLGTTLALAAACLTGCSQRSLAAGDPIPQPVGYRSWHHEKSMVIQPGHSLHASFGGIHHVYANEAAHRGLSTGNYEDGAVFAFDLLATEEGGGAIQEGARKVLGVMHRAKAAFASTGGWGFAGFDGDGKNVVTDMRTQCFQCHEPQRARNFVFTAARP